MSSRSLFQRRHYEAIADAIRYPTNPIYALASMFKHDNPNFSKDRFLDAALERREPEPSDPTLTTALILLFDGRDSDDVLSAVNNALLPRRLPQE
jgi:hypothetical protein